MAAIPPALAEVVATYNICGITAAHANIIIASQGFTSMEDFNDLEKFKASSLIFMRTHS